jgi:putative ABC transport system permease protein
MIRVAIKGLLGRKLRAALTALAIVLGVAMVSGTFVLTDTIKKGFTTIFTSSYKNADAVITGKTSFGGQGTLSPSFPASLLTRVEQAPGVEYAAGGVNDIGVHLVGRSGKTISAGGAPNLGFSVQGGSDQRFNPLTLVSGHWPSGPNQIAIDVATAHNKHYSVGDSIGVEVHGPTRTFRVAGIAELGGVASIGGATLAIFDLPTAQHLFQKVGKLDTIQVAESSGTSTKALLSEIRGLLPANTIVRTSAAQSKEDANDASSFLSILQEFLLAFGIIALFVGAFVIANTLSITIAQRTRELATLRTLGATRRQVLVSVLLESFIVGVLASLTGLVAGLALASGLDKLFGAFGAKLPEAGTVFAPRTVVVSLLLGILVTLGASLWPAIRATRVPPIAAVREGSVLPKSSLARFVPLAALIVGGLGMAGILFGAFGSGLSTTDRLIMLGVGVLLLFVGVAIIAPRIVRPIAAVVDPVAKWGVVVLSVLVYPISFLIWLLRRGFRFLIRRPPGFEIPGVLPDRIANRLAAQNALRAPGRTASAAAALMIGLALVTFVAVLAAGLKSSFEGAVHKEFRGDYALTSQNGFNPTDISSATALRKVPGVTAVAGVRAGQGKAFGNQFALTAVDPGISQLVVVDWKSGSQASLEQLGRAGAVVDDKYAKKHHLSPGSSLRMLTPYGKTLDLHIVGIFKLPSGGSPFGTVTLSAATFDANYPDPQNVFAFANIVGGVTPANTAKLVRALKAFPDAKIQTEKQFESSQESGINSLLVLLFVLLGLSVIISLVGIVNTLVLTVFERTRELGMLRAVGMSRRQVRRMIRHESVVTALIGAALGIPLGIALAWLIGRAINFSAFALPWTQLASFVIAAVVAGILAAIFPARRAARLNVLAALQYE